MARQLMLIEPDPGQWRLDERTKQIGRDGIAAARDAMRDAARRAAARQAEDASSRTAA